MVDELAQREARLNITYNGENGDLPDMVLFDSTDGDVKSWASEAVAGGSVPGIPADDNVDFTDFVVDRFEAKVDRPTALIALRPKTPFGVQDSVW